MSQNITGLEVFNNRLNKGDFKKRITITPIISEKQIGNGVVDLRLGNEFILTKKTRFSNLNLRDPSLKENIKSYQEKISIKSNDRIMLHPNQFILGSTLEYVKLPNDIKAYIIGRSSWGRLGLIIATATLINPGFAGVVTLELTNVGEVPISLFPGLRIAQISFHKCDFAYEKKKVDPGKYFGSTGPSFSEIYRDRDLMLIERDLDQEKIEKKIDILTSILTSDNSKDISIFLNEIKNKIKYYKDKVDKNIQKKFKELKKLSLKIEKKE